MDVDIVFLVCSHIQLGLDTDMRHPPISGGRIEFASGQKASQGLNGPLSSPALFRRGVNIWGGNRIPQWRSG
eukprot:6743881-Pyramimonas_sp.AAC.1